MLLNSTSKGITTATCYEGGEFEYLLEQKDCKRSSSRRGKFERQLADQWGDAEVSCESSSSFEAQPQHRSRHVLRFRCIPGCPQRFCQELVPPAVVPEDFEQDLAWGTTEVQSRVGKAASFCWQ